MILWKFRNAHKKLKKKLRNSRNKKQNFKQKNQGFGKSTWFTVHAENRVQNKRAVRRYVDYIRNAIFLTACSFHSTPFFAETSKADYVLFEASGLIKEGLIREWSRLSPDDIKALRAYLLAYVTGVAANSIFSWWKICKFRILWVSYSIPFSNSPFLIFLSEKLFLTDLTLL